MLRGNSLSTIKGLTQVSDLLEAQQVFMLATAMSCRCEYMSSNVDFTVVV
jgi:hypothetical protein